MMLKKQKKNEKMIHTLISCSFLLILKDGRTTRRQSNTWLRIKIGSNNVIMSFHIIIKIIE